MSAPTSVATARGAVAPARPAPMPRIDWLDGIRAAAAMFVVLHHCWLAVFPTYPHQSGPWFLGWMLYGHVAVSVFIVVSGFSLSIAPARRGWRLTRGVRGFIYRRAWRILPTYWAALVISAIVVGLVTPEQTGDQVSLKAIVVHALLLQDVVDSPKPNGAFWSIAVEWQIYFLFPLLLLLLRWTGPRRLVAAVAALVVTGYLLATHVEVFHRFLNLTPQYLVLFAMGMAAAGVVRTGAGPRPRWLLAGGGAAAAGFLVLARVYGSEAVVRQFFWVDLLLGAAAALTIAGLAAGGGAGLRRALASRPLAWTGGFSYSIYCIHAPVVWLVWHFVVADWDLDPTSHLLAYLTVAVPVVLVTSWTFYLAFEKPFLTRRTWAAWAEVARGLPRIAPHHWVRRTASGWSRPRGS
jgi:peptidoglycan/LPS O-acetylase OafA/YrhL